MARCSRRSRVVVVCGGGRTPHTPSKPKLKNTRSSNCPPPPLQQEASSAGFRKIARFIFGANTRADAAGGGGGGGSEAAGGSGSEAVAMTSPVRQELVVRCSQRFAGCLAACFAALQCSVYCCVAFAALSCRRSAALRCCAHNNNNNQQHLHALPLQCNPLYPHPAPSNNSPSPSR